MKRMISLLLAALLALCWAAALGEAGIANPWTDTDADGLMDTLGLRLGVPEGATNVTWRMLVEYQMGEVQFTWQGENYIARVAPTDDFQNISGMEYHWEQQTGCSVGRCDGFVYRAHDGGNTVDLCLWYDALTGLMYSVGVVDTDLEGFDITAAAQEIFVPMQTE